MGFDRPHADRARAVDARNAGSFDSQRDLSSVCRHRARHDPGYGSGGRDRHSSERRVQAADAARGSNIEAFAKFWRAFATHLAKRNPESLFLEVINEPMVEDGYRWYGIQQKLIASTRARRGTRSSRPVIAGRGFTKCSSRMPIERDLQLSFLRAVCIYTPGCDVGWSTLPFYKNIPYPSSPDAVKLLLDTIQDEPARYNLLRYGEDNWNAGRIDRELVSRRRGPRDIASTSRATSLARSAGSRSRQTGWRGFTTCGRRWRNMASVGPCGIMPAVSPSSTKPTGKLNANRSC